MGRLTRTRGLSPLSELPINSEFALEKPKGPKPQCDAATKRAPDIFPFDIQEALHNSDTFGRIQLTDESRLTRKLPNTQVSGMSANVLAYTPAT